MASYGKSVLLFVLILIISLNNVSALTEYDMYQYDTNSSISWTNSTYKIGQAILFPLTLHDRITGVEISIKKTGSPSGGVLEYYALDDNEEPTGSVLASTSFDNTGIGTTCSLKWIPLNFDLTLPGDPYDRDFLLFAISATNVDVSNYYSICIGNSNPYGEYIDGNLNEWDYVDNTWYEDVDTDLTFSYTFYYNDESYSAPSLIYPSNGVSGIPLTPTNNWSTVTDPDGDTPMHYIFAHKVSGGGGFSEEGTTGTSYVNSWANSYSTTYEWYVKVQDDWCYNHGGCTTKQSSTYSFTTISAPPPSTNTSSIYNLSASAFSDSYITWNWTNPSSNYSHVMIYKNGAWVANVSNSSYTVNFNGLDANTNYTIGTRSVSVDGNVNATWVNATQKTSIACPANAICNLRSNLTFSTHGIYMDDPLHEGGFTFKIHSADSNYRVKEITSIQMLLRSGAEPAVNDPCVNIYAVSGGLPTGDSIGYDCGDAADIPNIESSGLEWVYVLTSPVSILDNVDYAVAVTGGSAGINYLFVIESDNYYPPYGQSVVYLNGTWVTNSSREPSYIITYNLEAVPQGQISYGASSYNITTKPTINVNLTSPSYFWNDYYARIKYPNGTIFEDVEIPTDSSMPMSFQRFHNVTGNWTVQAIECWLGVCSSPTILGSDTVIINPNYANDSTIAWLQDTYANYTVAQYNTTLVNPDHYFNDYYVVLKNSSDVQVSSSEILSSYPNVVTWNVTLDEVGIWNVSIIECVSGECLYPNVIHNDTVEVTDTLGIVSSNPSSPVSTVYDIYSDSFNITYNKDVDYVKWYNGTTLVQTTDSLLFGQVSTYNAVAGNYLPGTYVINATACTVSLQCISKLWNWTVNPSNYSISGYLKNGSGTLLVGTVSVFGITTVNSDSNGYYHATGLMPGNKIVNAGASGYFDQQQVVEILSSNITNLNFTLVSTSGDKDPAGYIFDSVTGLVVSDAHVELTTFGKTDCPTQYSCYAHAYSNSTGYWMIAVLPDGTGVYNYTVSRLGYTSLSGNATFTEGTYDNNFTLVPSSGQLSGTIYTKIPIDAPYAAELDMKLYQKNMDSTLRTLSVGGTIALYDGFVWKATDIDLGARTISMSLLKDGVEVGTCYAEAGRLCQVRIYETDDIIYFLHLDVKDVVAGNELQVAHVYVGVSTYVKSFWYKLFVDYPAFVIQFPVMALFFVDPSENLEEFDKFGLGFDDPDFISCPPTSENPSGGCYAKLYLNREYLFKTEITIPQNKSYNTMNLMLKAGTLTNNRIFEYQFTDDSIEFDSEFPRTGYMEMTVAGDQNTYNSVSIPYGTYDDDGDGIISAWYRVRAGAGTMLIWDISVNVECVSCDDALLSDVVIRYPTDSGYKTILSSKTGRYSIIIPYGTQKVYFEKQGYEHKNYSVIFNATNRTQTLNLYLNKTDVNYSINDTKIWVEPPTFTKGSQTPRIHYVLNQLFDKHQIIIQRFGSKNILCTYDNLIRNSEQIIPFGSSCQLDVGHYNIHLQGAHKFLFYYGDWFPIGSNNFSIRSLNASVSWDQSKYFLNDTMKLFVDLPDGQGNKRVSVVDPNGKLIYNLIHSQSLGIQEVEFNTSNRSYSGNGSNYTGYVYPVGKYTAQVEGNSNLSVTELIDLPNDKFALVIPDSVPYGQSVAIRYVSPKQTTLHIINDKGYDVIQPVYVQSANGIYNYNTSNLPKGEVTLIVKLVLGGTKEMVNDSFYVGKAESASGIGTSEGAVTAVGTNLQYLISMPFFWGIILFVIAIIGIAKYSPNSIGIVAIILINVEALVGLLDPYGKYVIVLSMLIAAISFMVIQRQHT